MAKTQTDSVYRIVDVVGVSEKSWEDAGRPAVETAAGSLRDLRVAEVTQMDMKVEEGKVTAFRTRVALSFKYESGRRLQHGIRIDLSGLAELPSQIASASVTSFLCRFT
jgi:hypothetical protein